MKKPYSISFFKHLLIVVSGAALLFCSVSQAEQQDIVELEEMTIGSYIGRPATQRISPVAILDREFIERSGAVTLNELFRKNIYTSAGVIDEQFTQGFAPASAGIDLRGMGLSRTLVLLDGRRMPVFPFGQSKIGAGNSDSFVDINLIPLGAVERVEILKDGASALYGADAVAGVVNIITRKDYHGVFLSGQYGGTLEGDGEEGQFNMHAGYSGESTNITFALDYLNRSQVMASDRDISRSANGVIDDRSNAGNPGTVVHVVPALSFEPNPSCPAGNIDGGFCKFDFAPYNTLIPEVERTGLMLSFDHEFNDAIGVFARGTYSHSESERALAPTPTDFRVLPANPNNPFPAEPFVFAIRRLTELGPRVDQFETDAYNIIGGLQGSINSWDWELGLGTGYVKSTIRGVSGYVKKSVIDDLVASGAFNPFGSNPNFSPASVRYQTERIGKSRIYMIDLKANGEIIDLPHGPLKLAVGTEHRIEEFSDQFDTPTAEGEIISVGGTSGEGDRGINSIYLEFGIPVWEQLEVQLAGRWDHYSDFGDTYNPKVGVRWQPLQNITLRGNFGTGFKAPALHELYSGDITGFESVFDPKTKTITEVEFTSSGNEDLDAEESKNWGFGLSWDVVEDWNVAVDYWRIVNKDAVISSPQFYVNNEARFPGNVERNSRGEITSVLSPFENVAGQKLWGIDLQSTFDWEFDTIGLFRIHANATYLGSLKQEAAPNEGFEELSGRDGNPRWRSQGSFIWNKWDVEASVTVNFIDGYERLDPDDHNQIASWTTIDTQAVWRPSFHPGGAITLGVDNLFDKAPPEDPNFEGWPFFNRALHSPRGRFLYVRYSFEY